VNAFSDLTQLRWLDLSDNRLRVIPRRAFDGLTLQHLFLNGNRHIRLQDGSFHGLATSGLYLHDCALEVSVDLHGGNSHGRRGQEIKEGNCLLINFGLSENC